MVFETEIKEGILTMNCLGSIFGFTLEDSDVVMARVIEKLIEEKKVVGVVLAETREYEYDYNQTKMLLEIANAIIKALKKERIVSIKNIATGACAKYLGLWYGWLRDLVTLQLRGDPVGAYLNLTREIRHLKTKSRSSEEYAKCVDHYLKNALFPLKKLLDECELIQKAKPFLVGYHIGDRKLYRKFFRPTVRPNFMYTKFMAQAPPGEPVAKYKVWDTDVEIFKVPEKIRYVYHVVPPEFRLSEEEYTLLDAARRILERRRPKELEVTEQEKMRELFHTLSLELIEDLADEMGKTFKAEQMEKLAEMLTRYTAGLGILEILLRDPKVQDIFINSPLGNLPLFINHQDFEECETNLVPTVADGDRWATRFKLISGRPLDEANPVGAGKTSFLGSTMLQILPYYRILVSEDTLELPVESLRKLGYNIQRLKSRSVITRVELELPAEEVVRTALRLGDSCLYIGEIRSTEAKALFEAMRIGAMANVVAGTIHGDSAYGVFDRIVNDLGVPPTSFKATDLVVVCNKLKTPDGLRTFRRIVEVTEIRKHWKKDPADEGGFVNLMEYRASEDTLIPTDTLVNGESQILNSIAERVPGWTGRWELVWDNIQLREKILDAVVDIANKVNNLDLLEAETTIKVNQMFHEFAEKSRREIGIVDSKRVYEDWLNWFKKYAKAI